MKLAFVYIKEHKALKDISIPLLSVFNYEYKHNKLKVSYNENYISDYYNDISINVIIGPNGSGKSTILDFIEDALGRPEGAGFLIWTSSDLSEFYIQFLNHNFELDSLELPEQIKISKLNDRRFQSFEVLKVNNIDDYVFDRKNKSKRVIDLSAKARNRSKVSKSRQLDSILRFIGTDSNKQKYGETKYKVKFRGWTPAIRNWIKNSYIRSVSKEPDLIDQFIRSAKCKNLDDSRRKIVVDALNRINESIELPIEYSDFLEFLSNLQLYQLENHIEFKSHLEHQTIISTPRISGNFDYYSPEDSFQFVLEKGLASIYFKNIFHIFKINTTKTNLHPELSSLMCYAIIELIINRRWSGRQSIVSIFSFIHESVNFKKFRFSGEQMEKELNKLDMTYQYLSNDFELFVSQLLFLFQETNVFEEDSNEEFVYANVDLDRLIGDVTDDFLDYDRANHLVKGNSIYRGVERFNLSNSGDIALFSETVKRLPSYVSKSIELGWEGLSSGEFAKISLFSAIYDKLYPLSKRHDSIEKNRHILIVIDEADLYLHPEWQRTFVHELLELINDLELNRFVQFIITTHSPLIIGDFLPEDIVSLSLASGKRMTVDSTGFGTQIADFYLSGMHLESTYGEHARRKLQALLDKVCSDKRLTKRELKLADKVSNKYLKRTLLND